MRPPGSATALASLRRTTLASSGIGNAAITSSLPISLASAALPSASPAPPPHSNGRLPSPLSSIARACRSTASPSQRSALSGTSGAILSASAGTPNIAPSKSDTVAATLHADDLDPAAPLVCAAAVDRNRRLIDLRHERRIAHLEPRERLAPDVTKPQHAFGRRQMIEFRVGPAHQHVALFGVAHEYAIGAKLDQHGTARAGHAVEENAGACRRHRQIPPTFRASASPSPTAEPAPPTALTRSSASRPVSSIDSKPCFHRRKRTVA